MTETRKARQRDDATNPTDLPILLSVRQAAAWLGVSRRTLYEWMKHGKISYQVTPSGRRRFIPDDLLSAPIVVKTVNAAAAAELVAAGAVDGRI